VPGVFGLFHRDGRPVTPDLMAAMARRMHGGAAGHRVVCASSSCGLGEIGGPPEHRPLYGTRWQAPSNQAIAVSARLDARSELCDALDLTPDERRHASDAELVRRACVRWGADAPTHLLGDWVFAAWDHTEKRLFLARDPQGVGTLYAFVDDRVAAFASTLDALLAAPRIPKRLDERYLGNVLAGWPPPEATCYADIIRLPVGSALSVTPTAARQRQYCDLRDVQPLRLGSDGEYVEACREILLRAVADRLETARSTAVALSGGLDSGAVAVTASQIERGGLERQLSAIAHVPQFPDVELPGQTANEAPFIAATARSAGLSSVTYLDSARVTPIAGLHQALAILGAPTPAAANQFWLLDLLATARDQGHDTLLTGQLGNLTISWGGMPEAIGWRTLWRGRSRRAAAVTLLPERWRTLLYRWREASNSRDRWRRSAIGPELAARMTAETRESLSEQSRETSLERRIRKLRTSKGEFAEAGVAHGIRVCDPTADLRLVRFCLSLPDSQFVGAAGQPRWLARRLLAGRLPAEVVWNTRRGRQAADLPQRLGASAAEVEATLALCEATPLAAEYLDLSFLRQTWRGIQQHADAAAQRHAVGALTRGMMVGLFLVRAGARP
jgi:asparagine synthase (glutamine-hydrolysing)